MAEDFSADIVASFQDQGIEMDNSVPDVAPSGNDEGTEVVEQVVADTPVEPVEDKRDEFTKWFEDEEGVKPPAEGKRENYLPHKRVAKISKNAYERGRREAEAQVKDLTSKLGESTNRWTVYENADKLAAVDPRKFLETLSTLHPHFRQFLEPVKEKAQEVISAQNAPNDDKSDPKPQKKQFPDGSVGYDDEGVEELLAWNRRQTLRESRNEMKLELDKHLAPFKALKEREEAQARLAEEIPKIRAESAKVRATWGEALVKEHEQAIADAIDANPDWTPADAAAFVLVPILNKRVESEKKATTEARTRVISDLNKRPQAAQKTDSAVAAVSGVGDEEDNTVAGAVRQALIAQGLMQG